MNELEQLLKIKLIEIESSEKHITDYLIPTLFESNEIDIQMALNAEIRMTSIISDGSFTHTRYVSNNDYLDTESKVLIISALQSIRTAKDYAKSGGYCDMEVYIKTAAFRQNLAISKFVTKKEVIKEKKAKATTMLDGRYRDYREDKGEAVKYYKENRGKWENKNLAAQEILDEKVVAVGVSHATVRNWLKGA